MRLAGEGSPGGLPRAPPALRGAIAQFGASSESAGRRRGSGLPTGPGWRPGSLWAPWMGVWEACDGHAPWTLDPAPLQGELQTHLAAIFFPSSYPVIKACRFPCPVPGPQRGPRPSSAQSGRQVPRQRPFPVPHSPLSSQPLAVSQQALVSRREVPASGR